jgi:hypothetical protein
VFQAGSNNHDHFQQCQIMKPVTSQTTGLVAQKIEIGTTIHPRFLPIHHHLAVVIRQTKPVFINYILYESYQIRVTHPLTKIQKCVMFVREHGVHAGPKDYFVVVVVVIRGFV